MPTTYDTTTHHLQDLPEGLPEETAFLPLGFYHAWLSETGFLAPAFTHTNTAENPPSHGIRKQGGKLTSEMLTEEGNTFTAAYYPQYLDDLATLAVDAFQDEDALFYELPDDWEVYEAVKIILDARLADWRDDPQAPFEPLALLDEEDEE